MSIMLYRSRTLNINEHQAFTHLRCLVVWSGAIFLLLVRFRTSGEYNPKLFSIPGGLLGEYLQLPLVVVFLFSEITQIPGLRFGSSALLLLLLLGRGVTATYSGRDELWLERTRSRDGRMLIVSHIIQSYQLGGIVFQFFILCCCTGEPWYNSSMCLVAELLLLFCLL